MKSKNLIVYFPGYTGLPKSKFNPLLRKFRRDGFTTYSVKYNLFGREDISRIAWAAYDQITKLDLTKFDSVTFIGHSMGGLVARKLATERPDVCDYLITLGTPHRGVQAASRPWAWIGGHSVTQMKPESRFLTYCGNPKVPTLCVTGKYDYIVPDGSGPNGMAFSRDPVSGKTGKAVGGIWWPKNIEIPTTHIGLIIGYRTYGEIYAWLVYDQLNTIDPTISTKTSLIGN